MKKYKSKLIKVLIIFVIGITIGYKKIDIKKYKITNKELVNIIFKNSLPTTKKELIYKVYVNKLLDYYKQSINLLNVNLKHETIPTIVEVSQEKTPQQPLIYIYNTHQTENYSSSKLLDIMIEPNVTIGNYILEEIFIENNLPTYVEETSIKEILNKNNWNYSYSYKATRLLLEQRKKEMPTLKYYIDIHRDSLDKSRTTTTINNKEYAKLLFLIGLENPNYNENLAFTTKINNLLNERYPTLSKGIYKKGGAGVNGIYNQDFSPYVILLEVGGYENTPIEVLNSLLAFSECFMEVINT